MALTPQIYGIDNNQGSYYKNLFPLRSIKNLLLPQTLKDGEISVTLASDFIFTTMGKNGLCPKMIKMLWFG